MTLLAIAQKFDKAIRNLLSHLKKPSCRNANAQNSSGGLHEKYEIACESKVHRGVETGAEYGKTGQEKETFPEL
jgi:hypothetical protein